MSQRTILFLIADTGAGHRSAANAIRNAIMLISQKEQEEWYARQQNKTENIDVPQPPTYHIEIVDAFEEYSHFPLRGFIKLYGPTIRYSPSLYGRAFKLSNRARGVATVQTVSSPLIHKGLLRLITSVHPDVIVSVHPLLNHLTIRALQDLDIHIPFITVVTDLVSVHYSWFAPGADAYIVPTEQAKQLYLKRGLDPQRVHVLGMPIDPKFTLPVESKEELQRKLGLEPGIPVVLLVSGGEGSGLWPTIQAISKARLQVQLLIITGRNKRLYIYLQRISSSLHVPAKILGFVHNMPEIMHASDVIVTKAGPGTICEALACGLPLILNSYLPGQEEGNLVYVLENNVGSIAHNSVELVDALRRLVKPGSQVMSQQLENAKRISRPRTSFEIANFILSYLPPAGEPGIWQSTQPHKQLRTRPKRLGRPSSNSAGILGSTRRPAGRKLTTARHLPFLGQSRMHNLPNSRSQSRTKRIIDQARRFIAPADSLTGLNDSLDNFPHQ
jgi:1,2-diacylglycerol 3-beta-galactosyltransferase